MTPRVAIMGWAQTQYERRKADENDWDIIYPTVKAALADAGLTHDDIDTCLDSSKDYLDGRGISTYTIVDGIGGQLKEEAKVSMDASYAAIYAYMRLATGMYDVAIVSGYGKSSEGIDIHWQTATTLDPFYGQPLGLDAMSAAALQASCYMHRYGVSEGQVARVVVKNWRNAMGNPYAQLKGTITVEQVLNSRPLMKPLKLYDVCPITDGASAMVMVSERKARELASRLNRRPVWIEGVSHLQDMHYLGYRDLTKAGCCADAARAAYKMAGIKDPLKEIQLAEVYAPFSFQELMLYEALGLCGPGEGGRFLESGAPEMGGQVPVNPSGGALTANPMTATGLTRIIEAASQIAGRAGANQIRGVRRAVAHGTHGVALQNNCVFVLGGE